MFNSISNIPIFRRLFYAFLVAAIIPGFIIFFLGFTFINQLNQHSQASQAAQDLTSQTTQGAQTLNAINLNVNNLAGAYMTTTTGTQTETKQNTTWLKNVRTYRDQFDTLYRNFLSHYQISKAAGMSALNQSLQNGDSTSQGLVIQQDSYINTIPTEWSSYKSSLNTFVSAMNNNASSNAITNQATQMGKQYATLSGTWGSLNENAVLVSHKVNDVGSSQTGLIILATIIAFLSTIAVVITIGNIVNLTITRPLRQLATLTKRIAKGETAARARIAGRDEIYMVATSMNNMLDNIVRLIQETQSQRDALQSQVEKLVSEVSGVGEGDLRVQAEVTADALGVLADSFNYMVEELGSLVVRVKMVANEVENSTTTILDRMTQLVEVGDVQVNQIKEAAVEVEEVANSSRQVAHRAQILYEVANVARQDAHVGRESLIQAVEGMGRINENVHDTAGKVQNLGERSREINEIVEVISSIAHQTNRLALDAAIQAAMAGENGKGFGAVAADIRRLAERSKDQASTIARIVRGVREDIGNVAVAMQDTERETASGTRLTQEAGVALESIFAAVEHQAHEVEDINKMAVQQLQSSNTVVQIMGAISESTQEAGASTRDASQNMQRLARLVEQLSASVEAFKLRENQGYYTPNASASSTLIEETTDTPMTVSATFRTVSASVQPGGASANLGLPALAPAPADDPFGFFANGGNGAPMAPAFPGVSNSNTNWTWNDTQGR